MMPQEPGESQKAQDLGSMEEEQICTIEEIEDTSIPPAKEDEEIDSTIPPATEDEKEGNSSIPATEDKKEDTSIPPAIEDEVEDISIPSEADQPVAIKTSDSVNDDTIPTPSIPVTPTKAVIPVKIYPTQQELHRELLLTHRRGLPMRKVSELQKVLEKVRLKKKLKEEFEKKKTSLDQALFKRLQKQYELERLNSMAEKDIIQEFIIVKANLRKTSLSKHWHIPSSHTA